jgi:hypothetical protein
VIRQFVQQLTERVARERATAVDNLSRTRNQSSERREALVEKNLTLLEVERWIEELWKSDADELDDSEPDDPPDPAAQPQTPAPTRGPKRRQRTAGRWGDA